MKSKDCQELKKAPGIVALEVLESIRSKLFPSKTVGRQGMQETTLPFYPGHTQAGVEALISDGVQQIILETKTC